MSLYKRITESGTLSEKSGVPNPAFALPATINWMRALRILTAQNEFSTNSLSKFYADITPRKFSIHEENTCLEQLFFSLHQCAALRTLRTINCYADISRVGIVTWYYGIYSAASAMIVAQDGSFHNDHATTATAWDRQIAEKVKIPSPFSMRVTSLIKEQYTSQLSNLLTVPKFELSSHPPISASDALGAVHSYLSGSAEWYRWKSENNLKSSKQFKALGVKDFRSKAARDLRNASLADRGIGFIHQAFRYRGKANYRETLFLGYGTNTELQLTDYVNDLSAVLDAFVTAAGIFCSKRLDQTTWHEFVEDVESNRAFSLSPKNIWG